MIFKAKEERDTPPEVYNWRIYLFAIMASFGSMEFGYDASYIGSTLVQVSFRREFGLDKLTPDQLSAVASNIVSVFQGGCFFGALFALPLSERFGRRLPILGSAALFVLGSFLQIWSDGRLSFMYAGRVLNGLGVGMASCLVPIYIAEFSPPAIRGRLVGIYEIMYQMAALIGFWINYGTQRHLADTDNNQWRIPVAVQVIPGGLLLLSMTIVWESPRWLAQKGRYSATLATLSRIRQLPPDHPYVVEEFADIKAQIARERETSNGATYWQLLKEFAGRGYRNRLGVGVAMMVFQNLSGINAINYYSPTIFRSLGVSSTSTTLFATGIYGLVKLIASVIFLVWLLDRFGRRKALLIGSWGAAIPMWYIGAFIARAKPTVTEAKQSPAGWVAVVAIYVFVVFYCASWNGIAWIIPSEIFPLRLRTLGVTITTMTQWLFQFIITKSTPFMLNSMKYGTYFFFASAMTVAFFWTYFILPETSGVTLEEMDALFGVPAALHEVRNSISALETTRHMDGNSADQKWSVGPHIPDGDDQRCTTESD